jgi:nucleoside 2-deoxyribosyltransferase
MKVYLSGPIEYSQDGGESWRKKAETFLVEKGFSVFNPVSASLPVLNNRGYETVEQYNLAKSHIDTDLQVYKKWLSPTIDFISLDLRELAGSDIVLANIDPIYSAGTAGEVTLARHWHKPIVAFTNENLSKVSGWMIGCSSVTFSKSHVDKPLETALDYISELYGN